MIPQRLELTDIQSAFRDVEAKIKPLVDGTLRLKGGRVTGAGVSIEPFDYVTRFELDALKAAGASSAVMVVDRASALDPGPVFAAGTLDQYHIIVGATSLLGKERVTEVAGLGTSSQVLHGAAAGPPTFGAVVLTTDVSGVLPLANGGSDRTTIALTAQTTTIGPTTIASAGSQFRFSYTLLDTSTDATAGTIQLTVNYTDDQGATSQTGASISLAAATRDRGSFVIQRASGNVTYTVTLTGLIGTAQYALYATLERLS